MVAPSFLILSQNCTTHREICNVPIEEKERREGGKGRGKREGEEGGGRGRGKGERKKGRGKREGKGRWGGREKRKWGCIVKEVKMEETERKKRGWVQGRRGRHTCTWQSCVEIKGFCRLIRHSCIYEVHMSPALNRSSAIWRFERSNVIEIHGGITFDFYTGLLYMYV